MTKTNAVRILEANNIEYILYPYEVDEDDLSGETAARKIEADPDSVFKTLVAAGDKTGTVVFCIPVTTELDLKKAAAASGNKKVEMIKMRELFPLTGYQRGGCSPIGMKKNFPLYIDETAQIYDKIFYSAGIRGLQVSTRPIDLKNLMNAEFTDLI